MQEIPSKDGYKNCDICKHEYKEGPEYDRHVFKCEKYFQLVVPNAADPNLYECKFCNGSDIFRRTGLLYKHIDKFHSGKISWNWFDENFLMNNNIDFTKNFFTKIFRKRETNPPREGKYCTRSIWRTDCSSDGKWIKLKRSIFVQRAYFLFLLAIFVFLEHCCCTEGRKGQGY